MTENQQPPNEQMGFEWAYEAIGYVRGARQKNYGHPLINFFRIANLWNIMFRSKFAEGEWITPADIALVFVQVKMAREIEIHKPDNPVDMFGYLLTYNAIDDAMKKLGYPEGVAAFSNMTEDEGVALYRRLESKPDLLYNL